VSGGGERSSTPGTGWTVGASARRVRVDGMRCCLVVVGTSLLRVNREFICMRVV